MEACEKVLVEGAIGGVGVGAVHLAGEEGARFIGLGSNRDTLATNYYHRIIACRLRPSAEDPDPIK